MTRQFFELRTPRDMLEKTRREYQRLIENPNIDNVFNFFVTANHIRDYIRKTDAVPQAVLDTFSADAEIKLCADMCDKGKHLTLTKRGDPTTHMNPGSFPHAQWFLVSSAGATNVIALAMGVMDKWEDFFKRHRL